MYALSKNEIKFLFVTYNLSGKILDRTHKLVIKFQTLGLKSLLVYFIPRHADKSHPWISSGLKPQVQNVLEQ